MNAMTEEATTRGLNAIKQLLELPEIEQRLIVLALRGPDEEYYALSHAYQQTEQYRARWAAWEVQRCG